MNREDTVKKMEGDLDRWNRRIVCWEDRLREMRGPMHKRVRRHLEAWRDRRNLIAQRLREARSSAGAAGLLARDYARARPELAPGRPR